MSLPYSKNRYSQRALLSLMFITALLLAQPTYAQAVKIMPLGSWTEGRQNHVSYRYDLWFQLVDAGFNVDFVGNKEDILGTPDQSLYPNYLTSFDRDHQGHAGLVSSEMISRARSAAATHRPDIVLVWMGPADLYQDGSSGVWNAQFAISDTIEAIRSYVPGVTILLGLTHQMPALEAADVTALNSAISTIATQLDTPESPVLVVDTTTGFDSGSMLLADGVHHNRAGETWVADKWFEVLADIIPDEEFPINAGLNDAWYYQPTSGQGFFVTVFPDKKLLSLAWFTYDTELPSEDATAQLGDAGHRWLTALGPYDGDTANLTIYLTKGGLFDKEEPAPVTDQADYGTMTLKFAGCNDGILSYEIPSLGLSGDIPIKRVADDNVPICEAFLAQ